MPCPPSLEEQEMSRFYARKDNLKEALKELKPKGDDSLKLLILLKKLYKTKTKTKTKTKIEVSNFGKAIRKLKKALAFDLEEVLKEPEFSDSWPTSEDADKASSFTNTITVLHNQLEFILCETRQLIYMMSLLIKRQRIPKSEKLVGLLNIEKERHIVHREEDRAAEIERLKAKIRFFKRQIDLFPQHESNESRNEEIKVMKKQIKKTESYTIEQILEDRLLFFTK
jgi:hypothetical protein